MVGRLELLTAEREKLAENAVRDLASGEPASGSKLFASCTSKGAMSSRSFVA